MFLLRNFDAHTTTCCRVFCVMKIHFFLPLSREQSGCDSDMICCCAKHRRPFRCFDDEYKVPGSGTGLTVCDLDPVAVASSNLMGKEGWRGFSEEQPVEA